VSLVIKRLRLAVRAPTKRAIDRVLHEARRALVRANESLSSAEERAVDAEGDKARIVLYARLDGRTIGVVDAQLHAPEPGDITISQIAVRRRARGLGVGHALVREVLTRALARSSERSVLEASVLSGNDRAVDFWEGLGLSTVSRDRHTTVLRAEASAVRARLAAKS
jgi:ribosomal protein S18 acetylase RimI-like enzyme